MIYLTEGNIPLNAAYNDDIVQEANSTYQLTFKFPTNNILWQRLREETFLTADDLHGEQDFVIFEVEKKHGYIQVYANQVMTMLNHYVVNPISLNRETGQTALSHFAGSITRENPFSFFSDIEDRHTFNIDSKNAMEALTKDKHSIVGLWGGDLVRHGYQVRLLKNGGSENESLFMYKKNLSSYEHKTSTKSLRTRITFITTIRGEGENPVDKHYKVVVDSPLINKYSQIYEDVVEVNDQDVKDEASLREYGKQYFRTTLCDMLEDSIEIDVIGQSDVPVQMFDVVGVFHEYYDLDVRKKITKYNYSPMGKKLKSIGFGDFKSGLASAIGNVVSDAVKEETHAFETRLNKEIENADLAFDRKVKDIKDELTDGIEQAKAKAEEHKRALSDEIDKRFRDFSPTGFDEAKAKAEEALKKAGTSEDLAKEAKIIANNNLNKLNDNEAIFAEYKQSVSERIANLSSRIANKADDVNFQRVRETAQLYERILGSSESDISRNASRLVMSDQVFQTEVGKYVTDDNNLIVNSMTMDKHTLVNATRNGVNVSVSDGIFTIKAQGLTSYNFSGFTLPIYVKKIYRGETYTLGFKYRIREKVDTNFVFTVKNHAENKMLLNADMANANTPASDEWIEFQRTFTVQEDFAFGEDPQGHYPFYIYIAKNGWIEFKEPILVRGSKTGPYKPSQFDDAYKSVEATRTQVTQLAGSYAIQTLTGPGAISSQINLNSNNILIEAAKIRLKGRTLLDEITAIDGYFKRLFVGDARIGTLNTDIIRSNSIAADKLIFDTALAKRLVSSDVFTDTLAAKTAFINKLRSVVVTATLLEGYKGKIGGFQFGTHDKDPTTFWITGSNSFRVGMSDGGWRVKQTCLWVNWGNNWDQPGNYAWFVNSDGEMHCYNKAQFWNVPRVHGNLEVTGDIFYFIDREKNKVGYWVHSPSYKRLEESNGYIYLYRQAGGYSWIPLNKEISDRRYKSNIQDSQVSALDIIESLKTYSYRKEYDDKVEDISCGIMAQDVQKYAPEAFYENPDGAYSYNTFALVPYLIKAIQELNKKIERLEKTT
nr:MAG TPA: Neck appendage protein [Caudoviricetes sp.]